MNASWGRGDDSWFIKSRLGERINTGINVARGKTDRVVMIGIQRPCIKRSTTAMAVHTTKKNCVVVEEVVFASSNTPAVLYDSVAMLIMYQRHICIYI